MPGVHRRRHNFFDTALTTLAGTYVEAQLWLDATILALAFVLLIAALVSLRSHVNHKIREGKGWLR